MKIITVLGKSGIGKSSAIRYALIELLSKGVFEVIYNSKKYDNNSAQLAKKLDLDFYTKKGYVGQITIVGIINRKRVCITTYGDSYKYDIKPAIDKGVELLKDLDLFVCASHDSGYNSLKSMVNENCFEESKKEKSILTKNEWDDENREFGKQLVKMIIKSTRE